MYPGGWAGCQFWTLRKNICPLTSSHLLSRGHWICQVSEDAQGHGPGGVQFPESVASFCLTALPSLLFLSSSYF